MSTGSSQVGAALSPSYIVVSFLNVPTIILEDSSLSTCNTYESTFLTSPILIKQYHREIAALTRSEMHCTGK